VNLKQEFTVKHALSHAAGIRDHDPCRRCNKSVFYHWPKMRDPKQHPEYGDGLLRNSEGRQETRHVLDRNLGGDVIYSLGKPPTVHSSRYTCSLGQWKVWAEDAVVVKIAEGVPA